MKQLLLFDMGVATYSEYDKNGFLGIQYDYEGGEVVPGEDPPTGGTEPYEAMPTNGALHRPLDPATDDVGNPDESHASTVMIAMDGGQGHIFCLGDPRVIPQMPLLAKGESLFYADQGHFLRLTADGGLSMMTTDTTASRANAGGAVDSDQVTGQSIVQTVDPTGFTRYGPMGQEAWTQTSYRISHVGGARFTLGYAGGIIPKLGSYARLGADIINISGAAVTIGSATAPTMPVAQATPLLALIAQLMAALTTAIGATGAPGSAAAASALTSAVGSILGGALPLISTQTVIG